MAKRCQSWKHRVRDCKEQHRRPLKGERRQPHSFHANQQDKGKHKIIYEDGFQRVQNRKNTIMNIFENEKKRTSIYNQEEASPANANPARSIHNAEEDTSVLKEQHNLGGGQTSTWRVGLTATTLPKNHGAAEKGVSRRRLPPPR